MKRPWSGNHPHKGRALWDRARELARRGKTDAEIAKELYLPELNVKAMTSAVREHVNYRQLKQTASDPS